MLMIRKQQMRAFSKSVMTGFENRVHQSLTTTYPDRDPEELLTLIRGSVKKAGEYGIVLEDDVTRFIQLEVTHGPDFHRQPWAADFLYKKPLDFPSETVDHLVVRASNLPVDD